MKLKNRKAYIDAIYERYHKSPKQSKTRILNELCEVCGYHRKYAIWKISQWRAGQGQPPPRKRRRRSKIYPPEVMRIVEKVWAVADYPSSVRLKEILRLWLPWIRKRFGLTPAQETKLLAVSPSIIDRALRDKKRRLRRQTDPFELAARVQEKLEVIWSLRHFRPRSSEPKTAEEKLKATEEAALHAIAKMFGANVYVRTRPGGPLVRIHHG